MNQSPTGNYTKIVYKLCKNLMATEKNDALRDLSNKEQNVYGWDNNYEIAVVKIGRKN